MDSPGHFDKHSSCAGHSVSSKTRHSDDPIVKIEYAVLGNDADLEASVHKDGLRQQAT